MNKLVSALINAGLDVKKVSENKDGVMLVFKDGGKKYRLFCAEQRPVPKKIEQSVEAYVD